MYPKKESHRPHLGRFPMRVILGVNLGLSLFTHPFLLTNSKKRDLGSYTDNPDHYVQTFQYLTQLYVIPWKDIMLLLKQTLTSLEKQRVLSPAMDTRNNYLSATKT
jgi:hypothetical protein